MKKVILPLLIGAFFLPGSALASSAEASVESNVETNGKVEIYQSVETTVNGVTVRKESRQPGKLELKMEQTAGSSSPTVTFIQESDSSPSAASTTVTKDSSASLVKSIIEFVKELFGSLSSFFKL